ncbi:uncharacterized protein BX664DRAFT_257005 [Halteromyces radiatus]|uniref:uncharacterized protein n=1 Tax=Halteromyces radiatus TaxID=101107 RepID=UPI00221FD49E|nr:uncharacterized protein BX664DRAFT_257005 [Halteromyces radiatus]KAI8097580.1 hypothetical protein BX664DRAFT_257005 [Halteromyces radiatus]
MKRISTEGSSKKPSKSTSQTNKASAISKQVLKSNPIPQPLVNKTLDTTPLLKPKAQPLRSSKVSQKLVLFPQASTESESTLAVLPEDHEPMKPLGQTFDASHLQQLSHGLPIEYIQEQQQQQQQPESDYWRSHHTTGVDLPTEWTFGSRTAAERMPKDERDFAQLPRVAAYCTGEGYNLARVRPFLREHHHVIPRQYDEALYAAYHFPLMTLRPDKENLWNIRVRSASPRPPAPRRYKAEMNYDEDNIDQEGSPLIDSISPRPGYPFPEYHHPTDHHHHLDNEMTYQEDSTLQSSENNTNQINNSYDRSDDMYLEHENQQQQQQQQEVHQNRKPFTGGEVFIFDYGVVVFWNFRRAEELLMLEDLAEFSVRPFRDNPDEDLQIEEMHFQYDTSQLKPRIFNDMITMKTGNHMIKLTLSHGLSQKMAETGRLGKTRTEITKINGQLFNLRMNVNLVSNVLDTPEIFWSEPALQPMYNAIREYLEIPQRAKILNDRLRVISDLLSMLRDHLTNFGVEYQTLIIIYLIIIAVIVACFEIAVKILQSIKL